MGLFDFFYNEDNKKNKLAIDFDLQANVLERCPVCRDVVDKGRDDLLPAAEAAVHQAFDEGDPRLAIFQGNREDLLARLRSAREPIPYSCTCENTG